MDAANDRVPLGERAQPLRQVRAHLGGVPLKVLVAPGATLQQPSGIEASGGLAFVTDAATSKIHAFKLSDGSLVKAKRRSVWSMPLDGSPSAR